MALETTLHTKVALIGLGAMGKRMARRLLDAQVPLTITNRSKSPADELVARGARWAESPAEAARGAQIVISMVRDDEASEAIWLDPEAGALLAMAPGSLAIESSTLTPGWIAQLGERLHQAEVRFLDAPVLGSTPQAEAGQLIYLVGGATEDLRAAEPTLAHLGGVVHHIGPQGTGATLKLLANAFFAGQAAQLAELLGLAQRWNLPVEAFAPVFAELPVTSPASRGLLASMTTRDFAPRFPIALVEKDLGYAAAGATAFGLDAPLLEAAHGAFAEALAAGDGELNISAIAKRLVGPEARGL